MEAFPVDHYQKNAVHLMVFCIGNHFTEAKWQFIHSWLDTFVQKYDQPKTVRYCGTVEIESCIKQWADIWFGCKYIKGEEITLTTPSPRSVGSDSETIMSPGRSMSESEESFESTRSVTPRILRRQSSKNSWRKVKTKHIPTWIKEITEDSTHVLVFSESTVSDTIMTHLTDKATIVINARQLDRQNSGKMIKSRSTNSLYY